MSVADDSDPGDLDKLLRLGAEAEARALRAEFVAFLRSDECKEEVAKVLRDPLQRAIASAVADPAFTQAIGAKVATALRPIVEASAKQAAEALAKEPIPVALPEAFGNQVRQRVVTVVDKALQTGEERASADIAELGRKIRLAAGSAIVKAIGEAVGTLPAKWDEPIVVAVDDAVRATVGKSIARAAKDAAERSSRPEVVLEPGSSDHRDDPAAPPKSSLGVVWRMAVGAVVVVSALLVFGALRARRPEPSPAGRTSIEPSARDRFGSAPDPPPKKTPSPAPRLLSVLQARLEELHDLTKDIPAPTEPETTCIATAIRAAEREGVVDHKRLREELGACNPLKGAPAARTLLVGILQDELARARERCLPTGAAPKLDGLQGKSTQGALDAYRRCRGHDSLKLETLADYVAAALAILDEGRGANLP